MEGGPTKDLDTLSCNVHVRARGRSVCKAASMVFIVHDPGGGSVCDRNCNVWALQLFGLPQSSGYS